MLVSTIESWSKANVLFEYEEKRNEIDMFCQWRRGREHWAMVILSPHRWNGIREFYSKGSINFGQS